MKRIFFSSILIVTILAGGLLAYSIWKASPVTSQQYWESGKKYYEQKKYPEAMVQFLNAIQKDPRNRDARYLLGLTYTSQKNLTAAAQQFVALLEYYPDDVPANLELGSIYLTGGHTDPSLFRKAGEIAKKILSKEPENVAALILSGNAAVGLQDYRSSVDLFEAAIGLDSQNTGPFVSLGTVQILQKNYPEAEQAFLKARRTNPKDKRALMSLGNYYRTVRDITKAEAVFKEGVAIYPSDKEIYIPVVEFYRDLDRFEEAQKVLQEAQVNDGQDPTPSIILADLYVANNRASDARTLLMGLKQKFPRNVIVAGKIAENLLQDRPDEARREVDDLLKIEPKNIIGHILLGEILFKSGQFDAAASTFETDLAITSAYPEPQFFLGAIAAEKGQTDEAQEHYQKSLTVNSGYLPARVALAEVFLKKGRHKDSREEIRKVLMSQPGFAPARIVKAALDVAEKRYQEAERELTSLLNEQPDNPLVHRQLGLYYESRGQRAEAEKSLVRAFELQPGSQDILQTLTQFYIRVKQTDRAIQKINGIPDDKKQPFHYELLGTVFSQAGRPQDAANAYEKAREKDPAHGNAELYLATQYLQNGHVDEGLEQLNQIVKKNPSNAGVYAMKGLVYQNLGKIEEAKQSYSQALKIDPNYDAAANNLAYILAEEGHDLETALGWAKIARKRQPESSANADTLGWVYYKVGNYLLARDQLQFAVSKEPTNPEFQYHLGMIYKGTKQINEAQQALKIALGSPKNFNQRALAAAALKDLAKN